MSKTAHEWLIPFNRPSFEGREHEYLEAAIASGQISGDGTFTKRCHEYLESELGVAKALLTTSCTHALEMMALLLDIKAGDEVILPSFTFVSTANAFVLRGAKPVFIDVRPDTLNFDERQFEELVTDRTRAAVPVHYAGVGCEMDVILRVAESSGVAVVEDNAHGLFGTYRGKQLGTFGCMAAQSFHETKNFSCGEGAPCSSTTRASSSGRRSSGRRAPTAAASSAAWSTSTPGSDIGSSYLPSDLLAAVLLGQFEARSSIQERRRRIWERYRAGLADWAHQIGAAPAGRAARPRAPVPHVLPADAEPRSPPGVDGEAQEQGHPQRLPLPPAASVRDGPPLRRPAGPMPVTEDVSDRLVRLPFYNRLSESEQDLVLETIRGWR